VTIRCPYDATRLPAWVLTASPRTHPVLVGPAGGRVVETAVHTRGGGVPRVWHEPLESALVCAADRVPHLRVTESRPRVTTDASTNQRGRRGR